MTAPPEQFVAAHREVQRKLGQCLIRLQQYEHLMKALVAKRACAGPASAIDELMKQKGVALAKKTLGHVVGIMSESYLRPTLNAPQPALEDDAPADLNELWLGHSITIEMAEDRHAQTVADLAALVELRNELVHHFLAKQNIWTDDGCVAADAYLERCYQQIDARYEELSQWAQSTVKARNAMKDILASPTFKDFLASNVLSEDAGVLAPKATIVELFRDAEARLEKNGWTLLSDAIKHILAAHPKVSPKRYSCTSWRQVLHESGRFQIRKEPTRDGAPNKTWYQSLKRSSEAN